MSRAFLRRRLGWKSVWIGVFVVFTLLLFAGQSVAAFAGGSGTESDPYQIENVDQLQAMEEDLTAHYVLVEDIDASKTETWNDGKGFDPIGEEDYPFMGTLDGQGYVIDDLYIDRSEEDYVGLFGHIHEDVEIKNVELEGVNVGGGMHSGSLIGFNYGSVTNSHATGDVTGQTAGGLIGYNYGYIGNSFFAGNVSGNAYIGGLVGYNTEGEIDNSYAKGEVSSNYNAGGLVGSIDSDSNVTHSYSTAKVTGGIENFSGNKDIGVGGLAGWLLFGGKVNDSYATGDVTGKRNVGGLIGQNNGGYINNSYATGNVTGEKTGGLVGHNTSGSEVSNSYATGNVTGESDVGGLIGWNQDSVIDSYATGEVNGENNIGGLVGYNDSDAAIINSYSTGKVIGDDYIGGLVGWNLGNVEDSFWDIEISEIDESAAGTGKTTEEMKDIETFAGAGWDIEVTDEADPTDGYPFFSWQLGESPTWYIHGEVVDEFELTINVEGEGTTTPSSGTHLYEEGEEITLEAIPDEGWEFVEWSGDVDETVEVFMITLEGDMEITANFDEEPVQPPDEPKDGLPLIIIGIGIAVLIVAIIEIFYVRKANEGI